jgi:diguanylate cyclase (GGDEF)-like protein
MINGKKIVALCTYRIYESQEFVFVSEFNRLLMENGFQLFIYAMNSEIGNSGAEVPEVAIFDDIPYNRVDIVVVMDEKLKSRENTQHIIDRARGCNVPVVVVDGDYDNVAQVKYDYCSGFEEVVRHIIEYHGVTKPHFMAGKKTSPFSNDRIDVFKKVIAENGIEFDDSMLSYGDFWAVPARAAAEKLLERDELPEAVICANDIMAINVCDIFHTAGIDVPGDVLVSGFDGIEEAFMNTPQITTASCDSFELAAAIMEVIKGTLAGYSNIVRSVVPGFIVNESCGCPKCSEDIASSVNGLNNKFYHHEDDIHAMQLITSKIMIGKDMENNINYLKNTLAPYAIVVMEDACFDMENNYFFENLGNGKRNVVFDSFIESNKPYPYEPQDIIPHLDEIIECGMPLVFNGLEYMGKCPGFVCYYFPKVDIVDYNQTPNLTNCFSMGLGGYAIYRYQQYLREKLQKMYQYDALTGLYNRMAFMSRYDELIRKTENYGKRLTVLLADLNGLKKINDTRGHLAGDKAIAAVAEALKRSVPENAICVRIGGDEMMAFFLGDHECSTIIKDIEKYLEQISEECGFKVSASIGTYATTFTEEINLNRVIAIADAQMYEIKRNRDTTEVEEE